MIENKYYGILGDTSGVLQFYTNNYDLRKLLLIFDKLIINPIDNLEQFTVEDIPEWVSEHFRTLGYLIEKGIIEPKDYLINNNELKENPEDYFTQVTDNLIDELLNDNDLQQIHKKIYLLKRFFESEIIKKEFTSMHRLGVGLAMNTYWTRFQSYFIAKKMNIQTIPICNSIPKFIDDLFEEHQVSELTNKQKCISVIVNKLPIISNTVPIEEIISYKNEESKQLDYLKLINWINTMSKDNFNPKEFNEHLTYKLMDYEQNLKLHKLKYSYSIWETKIVTSAEIFENFLKLNLSKAAKSIFDIKKSRIESIIDEKKLDHSEIAYIIKAKELNK